MRVAHFVMDPDQLKLPPQWVVRAVNPREETGVGIRWQRRILFPVFFAAKCPELFQETHLAPALSTARRESAPTVRGRPAA